MNHEEVMTKLAFRYAREVRRVRSTMEAQLAAERAKSKQLRKALKLARAKVVAS